MSTTKNWMPGRRTDQLAMAKNWLEILNSNDTWNIPYESVNTELSSLIQAADEALAEAASSHRNQVSNSKCKTAFEALVAKMRDIKDRYYKSPPLQEHDFIALGLKPRDTIRTPVDIPTAQATADVSRPGPHLLMLHIKPLSETLHDPRADYGYRVYYGVLPHGGATDEEALMPRRYMKKAPVKGEELPHSRFVRRKRELFVFPEDDSGKTAYFSIRYENSKGQPGPWGPVFSAVIP